MDIQRLEHVNAAGRRQRGPVLFLRQGIFDAFQQLILALGADDDVRLQGSDIRRIGGLHIAADHGDERRGILAARLVDLLAGSSRPRYW